MAVLTKTQLEIIQMISDGDSEKMVAWRRSRSERTIQKHIELAKDRADVKNMAQLVKFALLRGMIRSVFMVLILSQVSPNHVDSRRVRLVRCFSVRGGRIRRDEV